MKDRWRDGSSISDTLSQMLERIDRNVTLRALRWDGLFATVMHAVVEQV
jgi:hypothetical protein